MTDKIPEEELKRLERVGYDSSGKLRRAGSFLITDNQIVETRKKEKDVEILPLKKAVEVYPWVEELMFRAVPEDKDEYTKTAAENPPVGYFIRALPGAKVKAPVQACFFLKTTRFSQVVHNIVVAEPGSELHIITGCISAFYVKEGKHISITEYYVRKGALLTYSMVHDWSYEVEVFPRSGAEVEEEGIFVSNYVALTPARKVQSYPVAKVKRDGFAGFYSIVYAHPDTYFDLGAATLLEEPGARGEIISRVVSNGGEVISRGHILGAASKTSGHMECSGLLLGEKGYIHAIPELKGATRDTELSHEAAVGRIAPEEISYLMARGLDEESARALIIRGFLDIKIKDLPEELQKSIDEMIEKATGGGAI